MLQLLAIVLCAWLGWRRDPFLRWPVAVIVLTMVATAAFIIPGKPPGPALDSLLLRYEMSALVFPLIAYWLMWMVKSWRERARN